MSVLQPWSICVSTLKRGFPGVGQARLTSSTEAATGVAATAAAAIDAGAPATTSADACHAMDALEHSLIDHADTMAAYLI
ncbi:hypothetical protein [Williamsia sp. 1135]|uniref:hypothetical protein n=1 Tax=Williamsia sp. 1135 TaxID=1889262 RepID=UPI00117DC2B1|nr:hypothetical protein [Williamsia sp. 1135]